MAQVRNPRLLKALAETLRRRGVSLQTRTTALGWIRNGDAVSGVRTTSGDVNARASILCAGAWSADLGTNGVEPVKGQMLLLGGEPGALTRACIGARTSVGVGRSVYVRVELGGRRSIKKKNNITT